MKKRGAAGSESEESKLVIIIKESKSWGAKYGEEENIDQEDFFN